MTRRTTPTDGADAAAKDQKRTLSALRGDKLTFLPVGRSRTRKELREGDVTTMPAADVAKARVQDKTDAKKAKRARATKQASKQSKAERARVLIDASGNLLPVRDDESDGREGDDDPEDEDQVATTGAKVPTMPTGPGMSRVEVPLANGRKAIVALPDDLSEADAKKICAILNAYATP
jgi:hypothetical protein